MRHKFTPLRSIVPVLFLTIALMTSSVLAATEQSFTSDDGEATFIIRESTFDSPDEAHAYLTHLHDDPTILDEIDLYTSGHDDAMSDDMLSDIDADEGIALSGGVWSDDDGTTTAYLSAHRTDATVMVFLALGLDIPQDMVDAAILDVHENGIDDVTSPFDLPLEDADTNAVSDNDDDDSDEPDGPQLHVTIELMQMADTDTPGQTCSGVDNARAISGGNDVSVTTIDGDDEEVALEDGVVNDIGFCEFTFSVPFHDADEYRFSFGYVLAVLCEPDAFGQDDHGDMTANVRVAPNAAYCQPPVGN